MLDLRVLQERLLRAGIAPRRVRRYLTELRHHYDDLIAEERAHGVTGPAADQAAIAALDRTTNSRLLYWLNRNCGL